jgi:hypothetical protein
VVLRVSLLVRGRVPGGLIAAADRVNRTHLSSDRCPYYGRVVREHGYTVLQYWYFYAFNDWRSTYFGVNDHEADWEMIAVYLVGDEEALWPAWVAASSHDHHGDALRRRWDDPNLRREGDHPVVFPGAGSHSGAFVPGDYSTPSPRPPADAAAGLRARMDVLTARLRDVDTSLAAERAALRGLRVAVRSLGVHADTRPLGREPAGRRGGAVGLRRRRSGLLAAAQLATGAGCAPHTDRARPAGGEHGRAPRPVPTQP